VLFLVAFAVLFDAAPGYVADRECSACHLEKSSSFRGVGMAQSMRRPRAEVMIEDFSKASLFHPASGGHYQMTWKDGRLLFRSFRVDDQGRTDNVFEQKVDWIVGSGHRARVYLYQTPSGELYQLPIAWYTQEKAWGMAPGYDRPDHDGVERRVQRECLFCHNAYPEVPDGSDRRGTPQSFPASLPEGIGCQRCHGPGAKHIRTATDGSSIDAIRAAIVNPAKLSPERRDSVCFQCHLLPAVAMPGIRRFERADYSFRPGELLSDYLLHVDVEEASQRREDRFEINHHGYRLQQSACYVKGGITCITCHDPHVSLGKDARLKNVRAACLGCHQRPHADQAQATGDCVGCHMPRRRTQDVVHVTMTDHRIQRQLPDGDLLAPLREREPQIEKVTFLDPAHAPNGATGEIYRAITVLRAIPTSTEALAHLKKALAAIPNPPQTALDDLVVAELSARQYSDAAKSIEALNEGDPQRLGFRAVARLGMGEKEKGLEDLRKAAASSPGIAELQYNLGVYLHRMGNDAEALVPLTRAIELRPNFVLAWIARSETLSKLGRKDEADADLRRARAVHPIR
jgi:predicted CXXCH cytochrome family protein